MFPPLPPQPAEANTKANASSTVESLVRRRRWSSTPIRKIPLNPNTELAIHSGNVCGVAAWWGAVVLTVSVVMPPPAIEAGLKLQVLSVGRCAQLNCTVPVKPSLAVMVRVMPPDPPRLAMAMAVLFAEKTKSGFTVIGAAAELDPV